MIDTIDVSVIIVNWNTRDILRDCLRSLQGQMGGPISEVVVVDNNSSDGSVAMVRHEFPQVILIENAQNRGFAAANNQGMEVARGRYVLLLNSDTVVLDRAVEKSVNFADAHPDAAVVGCRVLNADRSLQPTCFMYPSALNMLLAATYLYKLWPRSRFFGRERMTWWGRDDIRDVDVVTGCFMLVRREAIRQIGVMDEAFFMYGEETDWCYRFKRAGWSIMFAPCAEIIHLGGASARANASKMRLQLSGSILYFMKKHRAYWEYLLGCVLTALFFVLRIPVWLVKGCIDGKERPYAWCLARTYLRGAVGALKGFKGLSVSGNR